MFPFLLLLITAGAAGWQLCFTDISSMWSDTALWIQYTVYISLPILCTAAYISLFWFNIGKWIAFAAILCLWTYYIPICIYIMNSIVLQQNYIALPLLVPFLLVWISLIYVTWRLLSSRPSHWFPETTTRRKKIVVMAITLGLVVCIAWYISEFGSEKDFAHNLWVLLRRNVQ